MGGLFNAPHGGSLAAVLAAVVRWTLPECEERFAKTVEILVPELDKNMERKEKAAMLPQILEKLWNQILPEKISCSTYGLDETRISDVVDVVMKCYYGDCLNHPRIPAREDIETIVRDCLY